MNSLLALACLLIAAVSADEPAVTPLDPNANAAPVQGTSAAKKKYVPVRVTFYYYAEIKELEKGASGAVEFKTDDGVIYLSSNHSDALNMEGSAWLERLDGSRKYLSYSGKISASAPAKYKRYKTVAGDLGNRNTDPNCTPGKGKTPCQPYKDSKLRFGPKKISTAYIREFEELYSQGLLKEVSSDGSVSINDTGGNIYGLHFDLFCETKQLCSAMKGKLKALKPAPESADGGFLLHMTFKCAEKLPDSYDHGVKAAKNAKERNALRPPELDGIPEDTTTCL